MFPAIFHGMDLLTIRIIDTIKSGLNHVLITPIGIRNRRSSVMILVAERKNSAHSRSKNSQPFKAA